jgi:hypothetical protein
VNNWSWTWYIKWDGVEKTSTITNASYWAMPAAFNIWNEYNNGANRHFLWYISNIILEVWNWSTDEVTAYYNQTKSNYWL